MCLELCKFGAKREELLKRSYNAPSSSWVDCLGGASRGRGEQVVGGITKCREELNGYGQEFWINISGKRRKTRLMSEAEFGNTVERIDVDTTLAWTT
ncbi:hypothetical protein Zmor_009700 [Zophobas morio]|uniref:Uncharacterized protein n=1 Tax=Zophobas morio TaxID=2755281 RepID=A0AA38MJ33_9CUCU|nr:hypothetical protein Zmor_009700 [Zophobas morio]